MTSEVAHYWSHAALPGVDLLRARFVTHRFTRHTHDGYAIALIESGVEEFEYGGSVERAGAGALGLVNPGVVHSGYAGVPGGWSYRVLYPSIEVMSGIAADLGAPPGTPYFPEPVVADPEAARLLRAVHRSGEHGDALATSSLFRAAVASLLRHARPSGRSAFAPAPDSMPEAVRTAREILHENLLDPPSLESLADGVGVGAFRLLRAFRTATGLPPHAYLNQVRVREARRLLDAGLRPAEVAARTGFADQAHLTRHFKRTVGVPPGAYRDAMGAGPKHGTERTR
ncbi:AraC family transcriptional regulator [Actinomadura rugatobispora]|uniref:AraC family ligand binding domain-containing protein n=1 Tax=Actinomadura rugatobispora TaxID=1994 RepID=A0ABW1ACH2_9ACTN|nr:AraC family transcriptional regulator [Actinomadura rugatobispora]